MSGISLAHCARVFARDIATVKAEVLAYPDDASLWRALPGLPNTGGTLALHLAGNLRHFIGAGLGGTGYVRDRKAEFATRGTTRAEVAALLDAAAAEVAAAFAKAPASALDAAPPVTMPNGAQLTMPMALLHLMTHLTYHIGQMDYHRRAVTGDATGVGALDFAPLTG
ncbi:MAG: DUF664 domain-containing protein [Gemmatimonadetes bacterium]|nr:DUF664 domain-containing protein [Gemmatimonadota bacterium]